MRFTMGVDANLLSQAIKSGDQAMILQELSKLMRYLEYLESKVEERNS